MEQRDAGGAGAPEPLPRVQVLLPRAGKALFDYALPSGYAVTRGQLVQVPLGRRSCVGVVWAHAADPEVPDEMVKPLAGVWSDWPPLPETLLAQVEFVSEYYQVALGEVLACALPPTLRRRKRVAKRAGGSTEIAATSASAAMAAGGLAPALSAAQQAALTAIHGGPRGFDPVLLFGVTGSGKTELFLRLIAETIAQGRQALVLVPEIGLIAQWQERLRARFTQARHIVLHSQLSDSARAEGFACALAGRADIVLGTRLAVFAPLTRLGLIVVDEEHDPSYKQFEGVPYSARDVALWRAQREGVRIVLGSATPSLELWARAEVGRLRRVALSERASGAPLPEVRLVPPPREAGAEGLHETVWQALAATIARGEQALVFLNRRGYAPTVRCPACGWAHMCPRCSVPLVFHRVDGRMRCHHCGYQALPAPGCPACGNVALEGVGRGTQRLEEALARRFAPLAPLRIDRDAVPTEAEWSALRDAIAAGEVPLLVGTQMLAKGHDFPALTTVVVVNADAGLFAAEVRAQERLMQQLMQVAGRAGRADRPGTVWIQTEHPEHPLFAALRAHDYAAFAQRELAQRRALRLPPFVHQALLRADAPKLETALAFLEAAAAAADQLIANNGWQEVLRRYDAVPMRLVRLARRERAQLLVETRDRQVRRAFLRAWRVWLEAQSRRGGLRWRLEVDPQEV